jgi:hypothetical protein
MEGMRGKEGTAGTGSGRKERIRFCLHQSNKHIHTNDDNKQLNVTDACSATLTCVLNGCGLFLVGCFPSLIHIFFSFILMVILHGGIGGKYTVQPTHRSLSMKRNYKLCRWLTLDGEVRESFPFPFTFLLFGS